MVDNAQLSLQVVAGTQTHIGLKPPIFRTKGESAIQYTLNASLYDFIFAMYLISYPG